MQFNERNTLSASRSFAFAVGTNDRSIDCAGIASPNKSTSESLCSNRGSSSCLSIKCQMALHCNCLHFLELFLLFLVFALTSCISLRWKISTCMFIDIICKLCTYVVQVVVINIGERAGTQSEGISQIPCYLVFNWYDGWPWMLKRIKEEKCPRLLYIFCQQFLCYYCMLCNLTLNNFILLLIYFRFHFDLCLAFIS